MARLRNLYLWQWGILLLNRIPFQSNQSVMCTGEECIVGLESTGWSVINPISISTPLSPSRVSGSAFDLKKKTNISDLIRLEVDTITRPDNPIIQPTAVFLIIPNKFHPIKLINVIKMTSGGHGGRLQQNQKVSVKVDERTYPTRDHCGALPFYTEPGD